MGLEDVGVGALPGEVLEVFDLEGRGGAPDLGEHGSQVLLLNERHLKERLDCDLKVEGEVVGCQLSVSDVSRCRGLRACLPGQMATFESCIDRRECLWIEEREFLD